MNTAPRQTLLLVDGSSYLYRAFHAMPDLRAVPGDPSSAPTGAIRGMINMLQSLRKEVPADFAACVFDARGPTFRDALYPAYKANRSPMPDDLRAQIEPIHEVVGLLGWRVLAVPGVEADDVIGTLAATAAAQGLQVIVSSGDKDLAQLVTEYITIIDTMNGRKRDVAGVTAEFGVPPQLMRDYQTLVGDTVDNVPGVPKVGPKTAAKWLNEFGSLAAIVANASSIKGAVGDKLRSALDWLPTGQALVTIKTDCDLQDWLPDLPAMNSIARGAINTLALADFYEKFGFKSLARNLSQSSSPELAPITAPAEREPDLFDEPTAPAAVGPLAYDTVVTWDALEHWLAKISAAELVAIDTETTSLDEMRAQIVGISLSVTPGEAAYIPLAHAYPGAPEQLVLAQVLTKLKPWLEDPARLKLGQHVKYDRHVFANHGIEVQRYPESAISDIHQRIGGETLPKQVKPALDELIKRGAVCFEGNNRWRRNWVTP